MQVGFYFDATHLNDFSLEKFKNGMLGVSGTDSSFFRVVNGLAESKHVLVHLFAVNISSFGSAGFTQVGDFAEAFSIARKKGLDVIVLNLKNNQRTREYVEAAALAGVNLVIWAQNPIDQPLSDFLASSSSVKRVVFVESYEFDHMRHRPLFYKGVVIANGLETDRYVRQPIRIPKDNKVFFLGSLTPTKGFHHLAEVWPEILRAVPDASLDIIGSHKLYNNFEARTGPLGIADPDYEATLTKYLGSSSAELKRNNVTSHGLLNRNEIIDIMYSSKVACINPNVKGSLESCSVSSLEAQLCGLPIVAGAAAGNFNTIVHKKTGLLIKNKRQLKNAIVSLLLDSGLNMTMRANAREYILNKYEIGHIVLQWERELLSIDGNKQSPPPPIQQANLSIRVLAKEGIRRIKKISRK